MVQTRRPSRPFWQHPIFFIVVFAVALFVPLVRTALGQVFRTVSRPLYVVGSQFGAWLTPPSSQGQLTRENAQLRRQLADVTKQLNDSREFIAQTKTLSGITTFAANRRLTVITAPVIAASPDPGIESIAIGRGRHDDIQAGQAVITNDGILVGKIATVHEATATVLLLDDPQSSVAARIQNDVQSLGLIRGERGLAVEMAYIPKNDGVQAGQVVVTSGTEAAIAPDVVIGTVNSVSSRAGDLFQTAVMTLPVQYSRLRVVGVIIR